MWNNLCYTLIHRKTEPYYTLSRFKNQQVYWVTFISEEPADICYCILYLGDLEVTSLFKDQSIRPVLCFLWLLWEIATHCVAFSRNLFSCNSWVQACKMQVLVSGGLPLRESLYGNVPPHLGQLPVALLGMCCVSPHYIKCIF